MPSTRRSPVWNNGFEKERRLPAQHASRFKIRTLLGAAVAVDAVGNGLGGVRNPYVDVPAAIFHTNSNGPGVCREMGREAPLDRSRFQAALPSAKAYTDAVSQSADKLVQNDGSPKAMRARLSGKQRRAPQNNAER
jgi:hypothetical protein